MFCNQAKEYLSQKGLAFQERDIAQDPGALAFSPYRSSGSRRIPMRHKARSRVAWKAVEVEYGQLGNTTAHSMVSEYEHVFPGVERKK